MIKRRMCDGNPLGYSNSDEILSEENDWFGSLPKAYQMKCVLEEFCVNFQTNNMVALYGAWGSGKSSVLKYLERKITGYKSVFFEAWQLEGEHDLRLSLLDNIIHEMTKEFKNGVPRDWEQETKECKRLFFEVLKSSQLNLGILTFNVESAVKKIESTKLALGESSYSKLVEYKKKYSDIEKVFCETTGQSGLVIFIDDLDRCEPSNTLDMVAGIKHFFAFGEKSTFVLGTDKNAVTSAICKKYDNLINPNEYLEKIFDLTFSMPKSHDINMYPCVKQMFPIDSSETSNQSDKFHEVMMDLFDEMEFKNPRQVRKLMNRFYLLEYLSSIDAGSGKDGMNESELKLNNKNPINVVFTIYLLILKEFYPHYFDDFIDFSKKKNALYTYLTDNNSPVESFLDSRFGLTQIFQFGVFTECFNMTRSQVNYLVADKTDSFYYGYGFLLLFTPTLSRQTDMSIIGISNINTSREYLINQFSNFFESRGDIRFMFIKFLINNVVFTKDKSAKKKETSMTKSKHSSFVADYDKKNEKDFDFSLINLYKAAKVINELM